MTVARLITRGVRWHVLRDRRLVDGIGQSSLCGAAWGRPESWQPAAEGTRPDCVLCVRELQRATREANARRAVPAGEMAVTLGDEEYEPGWAEVLGP